MKLFDRKYRLIVEDIDCTNLDFSFSISKSIKSEPNTADISIINLNANQRSRLENLKAASVQLEAGYQDDYQVIFLGDLRTGIAIRTENEWILNLKAGEGEQAIRKARINKTFPKGSKTEDVLKALVSTLGVSEGNLKAAIDNLKIRGLNEIFRDGVLLSGSASRELTNACRALGYVWSIQNGALLISSSKLKNTNTAYSLSYQTGLVGMASIDSKGVLSCTSLLIPDLSPGRIVAIDSASIKGYFSIIELTYQGETFSDSWFASLKCQRIN